MNALQIFQQNFNIRPEPVPAEDVDDGKTAESEVQKIPVPEIPAPVPETPVPEPEPEIPEPEPEILEPEPEIPEPEPKISVVTTIKLNNTVVPEVANTINEIRRVQRRSSKRKTPPRFVQAEKYITQGLCNSCNIPILERFQTLKSPGLYN